MRLASYKYNLMEKFYFPLPVDLVEKRAKFLRETTEIFDQMDANNDGFVSKEDMLAFAKATGKEVASQDMAEFDEKIAEMDTNNDGKISREEQAAFFARIFDEKVAPMFTGVEEDDENDV